MATTGETMVVRRKKLRVACIGAVALVLIATPIAQQSMPGARAVWWILLPTALALAPVWLVGRNFVCPFCQRGLSQLTWADAQAPIISCPFCSADYRQPMPPW